MECNKLALLLITMVLVLSTMTTPTVAAACNPFSIIVDSDIFSVENCDPRGSYCDSFRDCCSETCSRVVADPTHPEKCARRSLVPRDGAPPPTSS
ncbi:hypothetical protein V6N13_101613 [Hibiscus sabdariffa]